MIVNDQRFMSIVSASAFALALSVGLAHPVLADVTDSTGRAGLVSLATTGSSEDASNYTIGLASDEEVVGRPAVPVTLSVDRRTRIMSVAPETVRALLDAQHIRVGPNDDVSPGLDTAVTAHDFVRVVHISVWTSRVRVHFAARTRTENDARIALGRTRTLDLGRPGLREITYRCSRRSDGRTTRTKIGMHIEREPRPRVIARGTRVSQSLARVAVQGFESALHFAGSALHMIATAYTAGCYRCSGITASGMRAGFGIIAVDPRVIPLGTKLFIPGYGRAVAGDTGGAILGNRVDLGMNTDQDAMQFGRRPVTVYVLR